MKGKKTSHSDSSRRDFVKSSALSTTVLGVNSFIARSAHAAGSDTLRVGLIGCGGRGRGAAAQALKADPQTNLVALGDVFENQIDSSLRLLSGQDDLSDRVEATRDQAFVGFDSYQKVIDSGVDIVLLATPPHFRPLHLEACIKAGKHVFVEKPVAVDAPGVRRILKACKEAKEKNLAVVSGLCWRYQNYARASMKRIHDGEIGQVVSIYSAYNASRPGKPFPMIKRDGWSEMEYQLRNWYWFTWLSGDHIVEQAIHSMDKGMWTMHDEPPAFATSLGGLQARTGPESGQIYDHHAVLYEYPSGLKHFHFCRQQPGCSNDVSTTVVGTKGVCDVEKGIIRDHDGTITWRLREKRNVMHQVEHDEMYAALREGTAINNGEYMAKSTMLAIMGRMASYTGLRLSWEEALASQEDLSPASYDWDAKLPPSTIAIPGLTEFE